MSTFIKQDPVDIFIRESDFLKRRFCPQDKNLINIVLQNKAAQLSGKCFIKATYCGILCVW